MKMYDKFGHRYDKRFKPNTPKSIARRERYAILQAVAAGQMEMPPPKKRGPKPKHERPIERRGRPKAAPQPIIETKPIEAPRPVRKTTLAERLAEYRNSPAAA